MSTVAVALTVPPALVAENVYTVWAVTVTAILPLHVELSAVPLESISVHVVAPLDVHERVVWSPLETFFRADVIVTSVGSGGHVLSAVFE